MYELKISTISKSDNCKAIRIGNAQEFDLKMLAYVQTGFCILVQQI